MTNLLQNPSFEQGHYHHNGIAELQVPNGWNLWFAPSEVPNPHDPAPHARFGQPEVRVLPVHQLPDHERELFVLSGSHCLKAFRGPGAWWANLSQVLELQPGYYTFTVRIFADLVKGYDENDQKIWADDPQMRDGLFRFVVDYMSQDWTPLFPGKWNTLTQKFHADGETSVAVGLMCPFALKNSGIFADLWSLELTEPPAQPREDYARTYNVIPAGATEEQAIAIFVEGWRRSRETAGASYDDAMMGALTTKTANLYGIHPADQPDFIAFRNQHYPGTVIQFLPMPETEPATEEPEEPDPPQPPAPPPQLGEFLSLHMQTGVYDWLEFVRILQPAWVKVFWMEAAREVKAVSPDTKVLFRHHVSHQAPFLQNPDKKAAVNEFLARFWEGIEKNPDIDAIEGLNETIATNDIAGIQNAVDFEVALSDEVARRGGPAVVLLNTAVGNPQHGEQTRMLVPVAEAAVKNGHYLGYHAYWWATPAACGLTTWFEHHAGRALESWDLEFRDFGLFPRYLFTEAGAVGTPDGGHNLMAGDGWKSPACIDHDWQRYLDQLMQFRFLIHNWNQRHAYRAQAAMIFTSGIGVGWDSFQIQSEEMQDLAQLLERAR